MTIKVQQTQRSSMNTLNHNFIIVIFIFILFSSLQLLNAIKINWNSSRVLFLLLFLKNDFLYFFLFFWGMRGQQFRQNFMEIQFDSSCCNRHHEIGTLKLSQRLFVSQQLLFCFKLNSLGIVMNFKPNFWMISVNFNQKLHPSIVFNYYKIIQFPFKSLKIS